MSFLLIKHSQASACQYRCAIVAGGGAKVIKALIKTVLLAIQSNNLLQPGLSAELGISYCFSS